MKYISYIIILSLAFCGCADKQASLQNNTLDEKLISIAKNELAHKKLPRPIGNLKPKVLDKGDYWEVAFISQPQGGVVDLGGEPGVLIDKKTMKIIQIRLYQ